MHGKKRGGASHLAASWDFGRSWPIPTTAAVSGPRSPATMDKLTLRSALRACFNDMTQHRPLLLVPVGGIIQTDHRALITGGLALDLTGILNTRSARIKCKHGDGRMRSRTEPEYNNDRAKWLNPCQTVPKDCCMAAQKQNISTTSSASFDCEAAGALRCECSNPRDTMRPGSNLLNPALRTPRPSILGEMWTANLASPLVRSVLGHPAVR